MYTLKTTTGEEFRIDHDELPKLLGNPDALVVFRQGIVLRRLIGTVVLDENARKGILKLPGETEKDVQRKLQESKSDNIFPGLNKSQPRLK